MTKKKSKRQTRRSISVKGETYARLRRACDASGLSVAGLVEALILRELDERGEPQWTGPLPSYPTRRVDDGAASGIFTF